MWNLSKVAALVQCQYGKFNAIKSSIFNSPINVNLTPGSENLVNTTKISWAKWMGNEIWLLRLSFAFSDKINFQLHASKGFYCRAVAHGSIKQMALPRLVHTSTILRYRWIKMAITFHCSEHVSASNCCCGCQIINKNIVRPAHLSDNETHSISLQVKWCQIASMWCKRIFFVCARIGFRDSRMFGTAPDTILNMLQNEEVTSNFHSLCLTKEVEYP